MSAPAKDRGILFSAPMVRAILAGQKTVTRRIVAAKASESAKAAGWLGKAPPHVQEWREQDGQWFGLDGYDTAAIAKAPATAGDRLWVREAWRTLAEYDDRPKRAGVPVPEGSLVWYDANPTPDGEPWTGSSGHDGRGTWHTVGRYRHARFMPRWASRITLDVVSVRVDRLHDITEEDALAEGCGLVNGVRYHDDDLRRAYAALWCDINGAESWAANPLVWRIAFARAA